MFLKITIQIIIILKRLYRMTPCMDFTEHILFLYFRFVLVFLTVFKHTGTEEREARNNAK